MIMLLTLVGDLCFAFCIREAFSRVAEFHFLHLLRRDDDERSRAHERVAERWAMSSAESEINRAEMRYFKAGDVIGVWLKLACFNRLYSSSTMKKKSYNATKECFFDSSYLPLARRLPAWSESFYDEFSPARLLKVTKKHTARWCDKLEVLLCLRPFVVAGLILQIEY